MRRGLGGKRPRRQRSQSKRNMIAVLFMIGFALIFTYVFGYLDKQLMPTVLAMSEIRATTLASKAISQAIEDTLIERNIQSRDLLINDYNESGEVTSMAANAVLINQLCADIAIRIGEQLQNAESTMIKIPIGSLTSSRMFANLGPALDVEVLPLGTATVNYETSFRSVGINQVNFKVWINVDTVIQIVVPLAEKQISVSQKFTMIDIVLSGKVPPTYLDSNSGQILDLIPDPSR